MIEQTSAVDWRLIGAVLAGLALFGFIYNHWMTVLGSDKEGYVALLVAVGCGATLAGVAIVDLHAALLALACFTASGIPMIVGDILRYTNSRKRAKRSMRAEMDEHSGDEDGQA